MLTLLLVLAVGGCGSSVHGPAAGEQRARAALALWRDLPVRASPRPAVLLGPGLRGPESFPTLAAAHGYDDGRYALRVALPVRSARQRADGVIAPSAALARLRASTRETTATSARLQIDRVTLGTEAFPTDRSTVRLPVWRFSFAGISTPATVVADRSPRVVLQPSLPPDERPSLADTLSGETARLSHDGRTITIGFFGGPAGHTGCDSIYTPRVATARQAVVVAIASDNILARHGLVCELPAYPRTVTVYLAAPLGVRVLVSGETGRAISITHRRLFQDVLARPPRARRRGRVTTR